MNQMRVPRFATREPVLHHFEFRGTGNEFFRIWIVNIALTLVTLGIYGAWAKVRTRRYFYGNTFVAGHAFDYHASPVRILIGRVIALALFGAYNIAVRSSAYALIPAMILFAAAIPWLIVSSRRFNARNTSYRNVRFNFAGTYWGALKSFVLWPLAGVLTLGGLMPLAHRAQEYFFVNSHTFGGRPFATSFSKRSIYKFYFRGLGFIAVAFAVALAVGLMKGLAEETKVLAAGGDLYLNISLALMGGVCWFMAITYVRARVFNLTVCHAELDGRDAMISTLSAWRMIRLALGNTALT